MQQAIIRLITLLVLLANEALILFGKNPLPYSEEQIYEIISTFILVVAAIWSWWKNNNITKSAQIAQEYLNGLKKKKGE